MNSKIPICVMRTISLSLVVLISSALGVAQAKTLTIGTISADPVDDIRAFTPFSNYLGRQLAGDGIDKVKVLIAPGIPDIVTMLKSGKVDLFIDSSVTALRVNELSGSKFMLRRWKKGRGKYRSVIFATADNGIAQLSDLTGKVIAFEEPFSTSGFILPALAMLGSGLELSPLAGLGSKPSVGKVGYLLAYDNETQMSWLERDRVAAAAMAEGDYLDFAKSALKPLKIIHTTQFVPYHVVCSRAGLDAKLVQRLKTVLKAAHQTKVGLSVLKGFERTSKFDEIPDELLADLQKLVPFLKNLD